MIGTAAHLSFIDFILYDTPVIIVVMVAMVIFFRFVYKNKLSASADAQSEVLSLDENKFIKDAKLFKKSVIMIILVVAAFICHSFLSVESCEVALAAGIIMVIIGRTNVEEAIHNVEWPTLLFFIGLFVVVGALDKTGVIGMMANGIIQVTGGNVILTMLVILWVSALLSAILDNIPFVATMIPLILTMEANGIDAAPLWWALSLGACLGGNGTLIGASANVVLSGISSKHGYPITFISFLKIGMPMMLISVVIATAYLLLRFAL
ncbi:putative transporter [anaerobic digester metagenome]